MNDITVMELKKLVESMKRRKSTVMTVVAIVLSVAAVAVAAVVIIKKLKSRGRNEQWIEDEEFLYENDDESDEEFCEDAECECGSCADEVRTVSRRERRLRKKIGKLENRLLSLKEELAETLAEEDWLDEFIMDDEHVRFDIDDEDDGIVYFIHEENIVPATEENEETTEAENNTETE